MQAKLQESILKTIIYSDIFDYPLTKDEIWRFLITEKDQKVSREEFDKALKNLPKKISFKENFYFLPKRDSLVNKRLRREKESQDKLALSEKIIFYLSFIPTIQFVGISGALAMKNSDKDDDIDLFVITKKNTIWITRFLILFLLEFLGKRRKRFDKNIKNKICVNFLIDEDNLNFSYKKQDLYNAHEIVQMIPFFEREDMYQKFLKTNTWVKNFLPNAVKHGIKNITQKQSEPFFNIVLCLFLSCSVLEALIKRLQLWYMKKHITTEIISDDLLAFHPTDYRKIILNKYKKKLTILKQPQY